MIDIILQHLKKYPKMRGQDVIKLIYQNEFGGGHMIDDPKNSLKQLEDEIGSLDNKNISFEDIGNDQIRVNLGNLDKLQIKTLNQLFVYSANHTAGTMASFKNKLELLKNACKERIVDFDYREIEDEINKYEKLNYLSISHSSLYRELYHPHYRVINKKVYDYFEIVLKINQILEKQDRINIAIDGRCGAGKSTLGVLLAYIYHGNLFKMDDFFLQSFQRTKTRLATPGGNVDYERFKETVIDRLLQKQTVIYQRFDCSKMELETNIKRVPYNKINIIEGTYSMHPYFESFYDYMIVLTINDQCQEQRLLRRNGKIMLEKFKKVWIPLENQYFDTYDIFDQADCLYDCNLKTII